MSCALTLSRNLPMPLATGNLEAYIQSCNRMPMLTAEDEVALARRFHEEDDLDAARQLVMSHLRLVISVARGYLGYGLPHADLIQEGNIGLMKAVKRFDPARGVRLVSFAIHWIKAEIHEYIVRNWRLVKTATTKAQRKLFFNLRSMKSDFRALSPEETEDIAQRLGVKSEDVAEMETRLSAQEMPLDAPDDADDAHTAPIAWLADDSREPTQVLAARDTERLAAQALPQALAQLDPRSRRVVEARWLADDGVSATLHDLAREFGVSAERIRQIEVKALKSLRSLLQAA